MDKGSPVLNYATPPPQKRRNFVAEIAMGILIRVVVFMAVAILICLVCSVFS